MLLFEIRQSRTVWRTGSLGSTLWREDGQNLAFLIRRYQKQARRLGLTCLAARSSFLHKTTTAKASARPFRPRQLPLSAPLHKNTPQNVGSALRASPLERRKFTRRHFFRPTTSTSRSRTCGARLRPRWVFTSSEDGHFRLNHPAVCILLCTIRFKL